MLWVNRLSLLCLFIIFVILFTSSNCILSSLSITLVLHLLLVLLTHSVLVPNTPFSLLIVLFLLSCVVMLLSCLDLCFLFVILLFAALDYYIYVWFLSHVEWLSLHIAYCFPVLYFIYCGRSPLFTFSSSPSFSQSLDLKHHV